MSNGQMPNVSAFLFLCGVVVTVPCTASGTSLISRLNYGVVGVRTDQIHVVNSFYTIRVHIKLPNVTQLQSFDCYSGLFNESNTSRNNCSITVNKLFNLWLNINNLLVQHSSEIDTIVPDIDEGLNGSRRRRPRDRDLLGSDSHTPYNRHNAALFCGPLFSRFAPGG